MVDFPTLCWNIFNILRTTTTEFMKVLFSNVYFDVTEIVKPEVRPFLEWIPKINLDITYFELIFGSALVMVLIFSLVKWIISFFK